MELSNSDQSLASHISEDTTGGEPGSQSTPKGRKEPAHWRLEEEVSFLRYLYDNRTGTDGHTFPKKTYMGAAVHIAQEFKNQKGGLKTDGVCKSKFPPSRVLTLPHRLSKLADQHQDSHG
jgi:hypothetical protein